jgi:type II secretory ATPase GspE/PulE/Tfp pilus assembly ATPase PilB-like protein
MTTEPSTQTAAAVDVTVLLPIAAGHTLITGPVGSGKTRAMQALWAIEHADPTIVSWVCDPTSSQAPDVAALHERYAAGHQASIALLTEARSVVDIRHAVARD